MPSVSGLDHIVLTVSDIKQSIAFYRDILEMTPQRFEGTDGVARWALRFGHQKINLHQKGHELEPRAGRAGPGTADLCFLSNTPVDDWRRHLARAGVSIELGPVPRSGAEGPLISVYLRDPDANLIEISNQL